MPRTARFVTAGIFPTRFRQPLKPAKKLVNSSEGQAGLYNVLMYVRRFNSFVAILGLQVCVAQIAQPPGPVIGGKDAGQGRPAIPGLLWAPWQSVGQMVNVWLIV